MSNIPEAREQLYALAVNLEGKGCFREAKSIRDIVFNLLSKRKTDIEGDR